MDEPQSDSPAQICRHRIVRQEIHIFSKFLNGIRESLTNDQITQNVKHDLEQILAWFIIDYFSHDIDRIKQARNIFWPQSTDDETVLAEQSEYVWDPEWFFELFIIIPTDISRQAIITISINKIYVTVYPLTVDATPLNYNSFFPERTGNISLNSRFINNENLNGTRHLTQQDIQTPSHFVNEEIVETITTTEAQGSISPIQPSLTTSKLKNPTIQQTIVQPTVKLSVAQKHSQMVYQTFRPVTKPSYKQHKNNFAEHNCNYVNGPKTTKTKTNTQIFAQKQNVPQPILNSVNFHDQPRSSQEPNGNYPFFQQRKNNASNYHTKKSTSSLRTKNFPSDHDETIIRIINDSPQTKDLVLTEMINQIFSNHKHEMNK